MERDITRHEGDNLGGVNSFRFIPIEGVSAIPEAVHGKIHNRVTVAAGYRWYEGYCTENTMSFIEESLADDHGMAWRRTFTGKVPKARADMDDNFESMKNRRYILDLLYNNGTRRLVGTVDEPMYFEVKEDSKAEMSGRNEYTITFKGDGDKKSAFYCV